MIQLISSPPEGTKLRPESALEKRTDDEIVTALKECPTQIHSQKNIWAFWDKGFENLRGWQKRNIIGWVRKMGPEWTVRVLDNVKGSRTNLLNFVDTSDLPESVVQQKMDGQHAGQHLSDLIRLPLLHRHGGIYLDVGVFLLGDLEASLWNRIADPTSEFRIGGFAHEHRKNSWGSLQNFCIVAQKGEKLLQVWQRIMLEIWKDHTGSNGLAKHPIFDGVSAEINPRVLLTIKPGSEELLQDYWVNLLAWEKLKATVDSATDFNGPEYVQKHVLLLDPMQEAFAAEVRTRLNTYRLFQMLASPKESKGQELDPALHAEASALVDFLLSKSTVMKLYHGHGYMRAPPLATFWEMSGNEDVDIRPGTFGEYLRHTSETVEQDRKVQPIVLPAYPGPIVRQPLP